MDAETSFWLLLGTVLVNVFCWGMVLLRVLQNLETTASKVVLLAHLGIVPGFFAAFIDGWVRRDLRLKKVMLIWSFAFVALLALGIIDTMPPAS